MIKIIIMLLAAFGAYMLYRMVSQLDFGQKFNGLAMVRSAKYGACQFLYGLGQAGTVTKFSAVSIYPAKYALPRAV